jgi:hypothetical protein
VETARLFPTTTWHGHLPVAAGIVLQAQMKSILGWLRPGLSLAASPVIESRAGFGYNLVSTK